MPHHVGLFRVVGNSEHMCLVLAVGGKLHWLGSTRLQEPTSGDFYIYLTIVCLYMNLLFLM